MANPAKYLDDNSFIEWVFYPQKETDSKWDNYFKEHPEEQQLILELKETLSFLISDDISVSAKDRSEILIALLERINSHNNQLARHRFRKNMLRYAAVLFLFISAGTYYYVSKTETINYTSYIVSEQQVQDQKATQLFLSENEKVSIENNNSVISYDESGAIRIEEGDQTYALKESKGKMNTLIVPFGKRSKIILADGSLVYLNSGSQLIYPSSFSQQKREVFLDGEAYFEIAKNKEVPFIVMTPKDDYYVKVTGTKFNVSAYKVDHKFETVLEEGFVNVVYENGIISSKEMHLIPGEIASWNTVTNEMNVQKVSVENYTMWTQGILLFDNLELNRIIKKLERYYNIRIDFNDPMKGTVYIGGKLDLNKELDVVLDNLAISASLKLKKINEKHFLIVN